MARHGHHGHKHGHGGHDQSRRRGDDCCPETGEGGRRLVLAGNPNTGKSVFFNALTGMYVDVSNYPGTTVDVSTGRYGDHTVIDTPGVYGVSSFNDEERVARDVILEAGLVVNVVDATHLDRDLFLTLQLVDLGKRVIVALNMTDEAERQGEHIDPAKLSELLGVPVIPTVAVRGQGLKELKESLELACPGRADPNQEAELAPLIGRGIPWAEALLILEDDPVVSARHGLTPGGLRDDLYRRRRGRVAAIVKAVRSPAPERFSLAGSLAKLTIRPLTGLPILGLVLAALYYLIGVLTAQVVVNFTEKTVMRGFYEPFVRRLVGALAPAGTPWGTILIGEFGVLTMTLTYLIGLLLPLVVAFYLAMSIMEDTGYLPRVATLADRVLVKIGLNGRAVIPLILGFGCVTMATITTRLLGSARERTIAVALLGLAIPCSAQIGVIVGLLAGTGPVAFILYAGVMLIVFGVIGAFLERFLPGRSTDLLIDLPPLRLPRVDNVLAKTWGKSVMFIQEAGPLFFYGALFIGVLQVTNALPHLEAFFAPLTVGWLHLPKQAADAFIMGIIRRDFGAAGLYILALTPVQRIVAAVTITLFVPCIASVTVIYKERGLREASVLWFASWALAFGVGGLVSMALGLAGLGV
ncbi:MAG: ferrous iron transport protein B [Bacillota bacterium]